jgi:hypothetical protein
MSVAMSMTMILIAIIVAIMLIVPIGVSAAMLDPIAFVIMPAVRSMHIARSGPIGIGIRGTFIVSGYPAIVWTFRYPIACNPDHLRRRWRRGRLYTNRRWCNSDDD